MKNNINIIKKVFTSFLSTAALTVSLQCIAASPLVGFSTICTVDENCAVDDSTLVAFGSGKQYVYKTLSGNFLCAASTFERADHQVAPNPACLTLNPAEPQPTQDQENANNTLIPGQYAIISAYTGMALTIKESDLEDGALVVQQNFDQQVNQIWDVQDLKNGFYSITAIHSQKALETQDWNNYDGASLQQFSWINSSNQHWSIKSSPEGTFQISSRLNGHVVDLLEMNQKENGQVCLWTNWGGSNQHWKFVRIEANEEDK